MPREIKGPSPSSAAVGDRPRCLSPLPNPTALPDKGRPAPFYRSFRGGESQATPTHEIDPR